MGGEGDRGKVSRLWESNASRRDRINRSRTAIFVELQDEYLGPAVAAAQRGDIEAEEALISSGAVAARQADVSDYYVDRINGLMASNALRVGAPYLGFVDAYVFFTDRVVVYGGQGEIAAIRPVDQYLKAEVDASGSVAISSRPTLTRMAATAMLPGSALIPGFALQKRTTHDMRELYLVLEHPEWAAVLPVNPEHALVVREIAAGLNAAAAAKRRAAAPETPEVPEAPGGGPVDVLDRLERLSALHDRGVLTDAEFEVEKRKLLDDSSRS